MTEKDLHFLYKRETGLRYNYGDNDISYLVWLEEKITKYCLLNDKGELINVKTKDES